MANKKKDEEEKKNSAVSAVAAQLNNSLSNSKQTSTNNSSTKNNTTKNESKTTTKTETKTSTAKTSTAKTNTSTKETTPSKSSAVSAVAAQLNNSLSNSKSGTDNKGAQDSAPSSLLPAEKTKAKQFSSKKTTEQNNTNTIPVLQDNTPSTSNDMMSQWLDPSYKLNKQEKQQAKSIIKQYEANDKNPNVYDLTPEEKEEMNNIYALKDKISGADAFLYGAMQSIPGVNALLTRGDDGSNTGYESRKENAQKQNIVPYLAGLFSEGIALNSAGQSALKGTQYGSAVEKLAGKLGNGVGSKIIADALMDAPVDVALDTVPELLTNMAQGKSNKEIVGDLAKNIGINTAFNTGAATLGNLDEIIPALKNITKRGDDIADSAKQLNPLDIAKQNANGVDEIVESQRQAVKNLEDLSSQVPPVNNTGLQGVLDEKEIKDILNAEPQVNNPVESILERARNSEGAYKSTKSKYGKVLEDDVKLTDIFNTEHSANSAMNKAVRDFGDPEDAETLWQMKDLINYYKKTGDAEALEEARRIATSLDGKYADRVLKTKSGDVSYNDNGLVLSDIVERLANPKAEDAVEDIIEETGFFSRKAKEASNIILNPNASQAEKDQAWESLNEYLENGYKQGEFSRDDARKMLTDVVDASKRTEVQATPSMVDDVAQRMDDVTQTTPNMSDMISKYDENGNIIPRNGAIPDEPLGNDVGVSQNATNTLTNRKLIDMTNEVDARDAYYNKHHNADTLKNAQTRVAENGDKIQKQYISGELSIADDTDVDTAMILLENNKLKIQELENAGNIEEANALKSQFVLLRKRLRQAATATGQKLQSFAKWNGTAEGASLNMDRLLDDNAKKYFQTHGRKKESVEKLATNLSDVSKKGKTSSTVNKALADLGNDSINIHDTKEFIPKPREVVRGEVKESLLRELGSVSDQFTEQDIDFLTDLVENKTPVWQITDELQHRLQHGSWYDITDDVVVKQKASSKMSSVLRQMGDDTVKEAKAVEPKSHQEVVKEVKQSFADEFSSISDDFTEEDYDFLASLVENKTPNWQIEDQLRHKLEHGEFYQFTDDVKDTQKESKRLSSILQNMGNDTPKAEKVVKSHDEVVAEVRKSISNELGSISDDFTESDYDFIATMLEEKIPNWQIEDEITHKLSNGDWYTLDESVAEKLPINQKLNNAFRKIVDPEVAKTEAPEISFDELKQQIKNTIGTEYGSIAKDFNESDFDYLANMMNNGATTKELSEMLQTRVATGVWEVPQETIDKVSQLFEEARFYDVNDQRRVELETKAFWELANCTGEKSSLLDKFEQWRFLSMLGNGKTHIRNVVGNTLFQGVTSMSNTVAAVMEEGADSVSKKLRNGQGINRTKAVLSPGDSALIKACSDDAMVSRGRQLSGSKYSSDIKSELKRQKEVFDSKFFRKSSKANEWLLEKEDVSAMKFKYKTSMAGYLKANGFDESIFDAEVELKNLRKESSFRMLSASESARMEELSKQVEKLEEARDYAVKKAEYSAFHEDNKVAEWLTKISREANGSDSFALRAVGKALEGILPYKKTPANILRSGLEYSPINVVQDLNKLVQVGKGNASISDYFESLSKTLTGTGICFLGGYLYDKDILKSSDEEMRWQDSLEGIQNYSLKIGGKTYTIDFAAPSVMPLLFGAECKKLWDSSNNNFKNVTSENVDDKFWDTLENSVRAANKLFSPIAETSMLSGVNDSLESVSDGEYLDALGNIFLTAGTGYLTQGIPTLLGQVARTADNTRRSTYTDKEGIAKTIDKMVMKQKNKIPFVSKLGEEYVDAHGRTQANSPSNNVLLNALYQMFSPSYIQDVNTTPVDAGIRDLYNRSGGMSTLPSLHTSATYPGVEDEEQLAKLQAINPDYQPGAKLSKQDYTKYQKAFGSKQYEALDALFGSDVYNDLGGFPGQVNAQSKMQDFAKDFAIQSLNPSFEPEFGSVDESMKYITNHYGPLGQAIDQRDEGKTKASAAIGYLDSTSMTDEEKGKRLFETLEQNQTTTELAEKDQWKAVYEYYKNKTDNEQIKEEFINRFNIENPPSDILKKYKDGDYEAVAEYIKVAPIAQKYGQSVTKEVKELFDEYGEEGIRKYAEAEKYMQEKYNEDLNKTKFNLYNEGGEEALDEYKQAQAISARYGIDYDEKYYAHAKDVIPSLTIEEYANTLKNIGGEDAHIQQKEILSYFNSNKLSQEEVNTLWNAYGSWETIPVLTNGVWKAKRKK